jgi:hypothetical protein
MVARDGIEPPTPAFSRPARVVRCDAPPTPSAEYCCGPRRDVSPIEYLQHLIVSVAEEPGCNAGFLIDVGEGDTSSAAHDVAPNGVRARNLFRAQAAANEGTRPMSRRRRYKRGVADGADLNRFVLLDRGCPLVAHAKRLTNKKRKFSTKFYSASRAE